MKDSCKVADGRNQLLNFSLFRFVLFRLICAANSVRMAIEVQKLKMAIHSSEDTLFLHFRQV